MIGNRRFVPATLIRILAPLALGIYGIMGIAFSLLVQSAGFRSLREAGYGDSYILYDVLSFEKTGIIYRDLT